MISPHAFQRDCWLAAVSAKDESKETVSKEDGAKEPSEEASAESESAATPSARPATRKPDEMNDLIATLFGRERKMRGTLKNLIKKIDAWFYKTRTLFNSSRRQS